MFERRFGTSNLELCVCFVLRVYIHIHMFEWEWIQGVGTSPVGGTNPFIMIIKPNAFGFINSAMSH